MEAGNVDSKKNTTIQVSVLTHHELIQIRLLKNFSTLEEVIIYLINKYRLKNNGN